MDCVPDTQQTAPAPSAMRAVLRGAGGGAHTVSNVTVDDVLADEGEAESDDAAEAEAGGGSDEGGEGGGRGWRLGTSASGGGGGGGGGAHASLAARLVADALLPHLVWRVGGVAATLRKVAAACTLAALRRRLLRRRALAQLLPRALPALVSCATDDDAATRLLATSALGWLLAHGPPAALAPHVAAEGGPTALLPALLAQLDDASNGVRVAACAALRALPDRRLLPDDEPRGAHRADTPLPPGEAAAVDALLLQLGDPACGDVRRAAFRSLEAWAHRSPVAVGARAAAAAATAAQCEVAPLVDSAPLPPLQSPAPPGAEGGGAPGLLAQLRALCLVDQQLL